jgi:hypothetical protein
MFAWLAALAVSATVRAAPQDPLRHPAAAESRADAPVPDFELADIEGAPFRLSRVWADGWVLIAVVRGMW